MPFKYQLTWVPNAGKWRKRYLGRTYYLKTETNGKRDREGYEAALREWERLKASIDGLGPDPYTRTGALIPENQVVVSAPAYFPPMPEAPNGQQSNVAISSAPKREEIEPTPARYDDTPDWIESFGIGASLHPELLITNGKTVPYTGERRIGTLAQSWLDQRKAQAERGELSLKQWSEDRAKLEVFRNFIIANYPTVVFIDQISPSMLNLYRDKQWEFIDHENPQYRISKATLKKRLDAVSKWLHWLVDQNILAELPKDLKTYGRVKLDKPKPIFWEVSDVRKLSENSPIRTRLFIMLALNLGYTQKDIATLEPDMIDWETGIVTRARNKTGVYGKARLWPSSLKLLMKLGNCQADGPILTGNNGAPLYAETVNENGKLATNDAIRLAFTRAKRQLAKVELESRYPETFSLKREGVNGDISMEQWREIQEERRAERERLIKNWLADEKRSFKHLRKTAANEIEKVRPDLTELFLAHSEGGMKRAYVERHFRELFIETDKLESLFGF
ncbi:hypothetical protein Pan97_30210 [Bremerella volcania]|uniref:Core-binding (CB) domain-containing protein n=1 Tax=Bremerella volcania TaxID=2527984 RepID=A0A518C9R7_9BACT|nr:hypothetical protein Pan97_30210 [Bremerella volcania]